MVGTLIRRPLPPVSDFIRTLLDDANATAALATLGIVSGTYTPTLTAVANVDASTAYPSRYIRVGDIVSVAGKCDIDATAAASTVSQLRISLPIASNLATANDCGGTMTIHSGSGVIVGDATNDRALVSFLSGSTANVSAAFSFMYVVQ